MAEARQPIQVRPDIVHVKGEDCYVILNL